MPPTDTASARPLLHACTACNADSDPDATFPRPPFTPLWERSRNIIGPLWIFHSLKAGRVVRLRGNLLYYLWVLLESDPTIEALCEQPFQVRVRLGDRWFTATIDIWARDRHRQEWLFAAVYRNHLHGPMAKRAAIHRLEAQTVWAKRSGAPFAVYPDTTVLREPQLISNWAYLLRFLSDNYREIDLELGKRVTRAVAANRRTTLGQIETMFAECDPTALRAAIFRQIHAGELRAALSLHRLSAKTEITIHDLASR